MDVDRKALVTDNIGLVKYAAKKISDRLSSGYYIVEFEDLVNYGMFGLIGAASKFDPKQKVKFATYAYPRILGSITDGLRGDHIIPHNNRTVSKSTQENRFLVSHAKPLSEDEIELIESQYESPEQSTEGTLWRERLYVAINRLPELERFVVIHHAIRGVQQYRIANHLGIKPAAVGWLYKSALLRLKRMLSPRKKADLACAQARSASYNTQEGV